jgi:hypothetical protein
MALDQISVVIVAAALATFGAYSIADQLAQKQEIQKAFDQQTAPLQQVEQLEKQLDALSGGTALLANNGNRVAQQVVAILRANGVTIKEPDAAAPAGAAGPGVSATANPEGKDGPPAAAPEDGRSEAELNKLLEAPKQ